MTTPTMATVRKSGALGSRLTTILVTAVVAVLIVAVVYLTDSSPEDVTDVELVGGMSGAAPRVGDMAPDFQVTLIDGSTTSLSDYRGQPVWLTFGASWCADCRAEAPDIEAASQRYAAQGLTVLWISISEDSQAARDYAKRAGLTFPIAADPSDVIAGRYHILGIPTHLFIDGDGIIQELRIGALHPDDMVRFVEALVA
ncbi:MAG: TlpA family protein disulfide reductase [Chloroflexota bacterium]